MVVTEGIYFQMHSCACAINYKEVTMDYSTLNRLKDELKQATSASKVASVEAKIKKEEQRILKAEVQTAASEEETISILKRQLAETQAQNKVLQDSNDTLKRMCEESQESLKKSRRLNIFMVMIAVASMLATVGSFVLSFINNK